MHTHEQLNISCIRVINGVPVMKWIIGGVIGYFLAIVILIAEKNVVAPPTQFDIPVPEVEDSVNRTWGINPSEKGFNCLALNAYFEARNDTLEGKIAVSMTVMNRVENARFPNTVCGVVKHSYFPGLHRCQFSWYCDGLRDKPNLHHREEAEAWEESQRAAMMVINGQFDTYLPSTHYHSIHVAPEWSNRLEFIGQIGLHRFYVDDR